MTHPKQRERHHVTNSKFLERLRDEHSNFALALEVFAVVLIITVGFLVPLYFLITG